MTADVDAVVDEIISALEIVVRPLLQAEIPAAMIAQALDLVSDAVREASRCSDTLH